MTQQQTVLFDISAHHTDLPETHADECLRLISEASERGDFGWLQNFQHHLFMSADKFNEAEYQKLFKARESAARKIVEAG